jgi:hypothetical protein
LEKIANLRLALVSTEVECKTTVCRVHLTFPVEFVGKRPPAVSLTAAMNGGALNKEIPENELKTGLFGSGFNGHGNPIALLYLEGPESTGTQGKRIR